MAEIFVDSSAFFAWADKASPLGKPITEFIRSKKQHLVTTNLIFAETISLMTKRIGKFKGIQLGEMIMGSRIIRIVSVKEDLQDEAWKLYKKFKDKDFDLIDSTSFVFCRKNKIEEVLTLDHHFAQMGFVMRP